VSCGIIPEVVEQRDGRMAHLEDNKKAAHDARLFYSG
jgi:hypothetical protein